MERAVAVMLVLGCGGPQPAGDFPAPRATLLAQRDRGDVAAMRAHMWNVWAAIADRWPAWERSDVVLGRPDRVLRSLQPFRDGDRVETEALPIGFDVRFNREAAAHIRAHRLAERAVLATGAFPEFPPGAIATKSVWFAVRARGLTAMPVWDGEPANPDARGNADRTWKRVVAVDPSGARDGEPVDIELLGEPRRARVVALSRFHHVTLATDAEVTAARAATHDAALAAGDHLALVAIHVTTKEIPDWTWATLWWHDRPDDGAHAAGRPASVPRAFRNYVMDVAYSADTPRDADGGPHACMNPWLEARFPNGLHSNCIACHQRAVVGAIEYLPVTRGALPPGELAGRVQTDFVWSIALEAR